MTNSLIGVVGPCAAGKSTLVKGLTSRGYKGKVIAQEHSYVRDMWKKLTNPEFLIFLDASYQITIKRKSLNWTKKEYITQTKRLLHAREHADLYIHTDHLSPTQILELVIKYVNSNSTSSTSAIDRYLVDKTIN